MRYLFPFSCLVSILLIGIPITADEPIPTYYLPDTVVSATGYHIKNSELGFQTTVISSKLTDQLYLKTPNDLGWIAPAAVPVAGGTNSLFLNGIPSAYTKVLLNGIELNNPTTPQGSAYWDDLLLAQSRIELIQNSNSLYGTGAIAGVINIFPTFTGNHLNLDYGFNQYLLNGAWQFVNTRGYEADLMYAGLWDASKSILAGTSEIDTKAIQNFHLYNTVRLGPDWQNSMIKLNVSKLNSHYDLDNAFTLTDDPNFKADSDRLITQLEWMIPAVWQSSVTIGYNHMGLTRDSINPTDSVDTLTNDHCHYEGYTDMVHTDIHTKTAWGPLTNRLSYLKTTAVSSENYSGWITTFNQTEATWAWVAEQAVKWGDFPILGSSAITLTDQVARWTYSLSGVKFLTDDLSIKWCYATSIRPPSLYERFSGYGSTTLNAETGSNASIGLAYDLAAVQVFGSVAHVDIASKIDAPAPAYKYVNIAHYGNTVITGKLQLSKLPLVKIATLGFSLNNPDSDTTLIRIPRYQISATMVSCITQWTLMEEIVYKSAAQDNTAGPITALAPYWLINAGLTYTVTDHWSMGLHGTNLLNTDTTDALHYTCNRRAGWISMNADF